MDGIKRRLARTLMMVRALTCIALVAVPAFGRPAPARAQEATPAAVAPYAPAVDLAGLSGRVVADGSSTVWPITAEIAERFGEVAPEVEVEVEISGTGGGFRRFCDGDSDLQNASRPITAEEAAACAENGVAYHAFEVGFDGITVVVNPETAFLDCLTVDQLARLWTPDDPARTWQDLDPAWPAEEIELYGPGPDSGTFDYFTQAIVGEEGLSRDDYTPSENDAILVDGVAADANTLGYFGFAYYVEAGAGLKAVAVDAGAGCVVPSPETIGDGSYRPLSRPLFVYVNRASLDFPDVQEFTRYYLATAKEAAATVGYAPAQDAVYAANQAELDGALAGTVAPDGPTATPSS